MMPSTAVCLLTYCSTANLLLYCSTEACMCMIDRSIISNMIDRSIISNMLFFPMNVYHPSCCRRLVPLHRVSGCLHTVQHQVGACHPLQEQGCMLLPQRLK
jgi:hypothetical protein